MPSRSTLSPAGVRDCQTVVEVGLDEVVYQHVPLGPDDAQSERTVVGDHGVGANPVASDGKLELDVAPFVHARRALGRMSADDVRRPADDGGRLRITCRP